MTNTNSKATETVTIHGVRLGLQAARIVEAVGGNPADDVDRLRAGVSAETLLAECLDGVEDAETEAAWREYVSDVSIAAGCSRGRQGLY